MCHLVRRAAPVPIVHYSFPCFLTTYPVAHCNRPCFLITSPRSVVVTLPSYIN
jgi:hypothetical protein